MENQNIKNIKTEWKWMITKAVKENGFDYCIMNESNRHEFDDNYELIKKFKDIKLEDSIKKVEFENSKNILKDILDTDKIYEDVRNEIIKSIDNIIKFSNNLSELSLEQIILYQKLL